MLPKALKVPLIFFKIYNYSLTKGELWRFLYQNNLNLENFQQSLKNFPYAQGYFFLEKEDIFERQKKYKIFFKKIKKLRWPLFWLKYVPGVKIIFYCNSLGYASMKEENDLDLFIVTKPGMIWTARFWAVVLMKIFRQRPQKNNARDKICLTFFATLDSSLEEVMHSELKDKEFGDIYFKYWFATLLSIYEERPGFKKKFFERNFWIKKYLPNFQPIDFSLYQVKTISWIKKFLNFIFSFPGWEMFFRWWQIKFFPQALRDKKQRAQRAIVVNNQILKFHTNDRRLLIHKKFLECWQKFKI